jgi:hypothetical protein
MQPLLLWKSKKYLHILSVCVCVSIALVIQHAMRARHIVLSSMACPALQIFSTFSHKLHDFRRKSLLNIKRVFCSVLILFRL